MRAHCFVIIVKVCLALSWAAEYGESADCLPQKCGEVKVSYPFALADRPDCPSFSSFFVLTCNGSSPKLFLPPVVSDISLNSTISLVVTNITHDSLIVDVTPLNASLPPLSPLAPATACSANATVTSAFLLPQSPGPFFISPDNSFASFGCSYGILITTKVLPSSPLSSLLSPSPSPSSSPPSYAPAPSLLISPSPSPSLSPSSSPSYAPASSPDAASYDLSDIEVGGCAVVCPDPDVASASLCGNGRDCCVTPLPQNSASRFALYSVLQSPFASSISCQGGTNYATLFYPSSSDMDRGIYYLKLMWALPSNDTQNQTQLLQSPEYACSNNSNFTIVDGVPGYLCSCNPGYEGDGYLKGLGCYDIDECSDPANYNDCVSTSKCENSPPGNYTCKCKSWFHVGDGRENGSGCQFSHRLRLGIEIGAAFGMLISMMGIFFCLAIWWRKRTKKKYFMQHGGLELQEILRSRAGGQTRIFKEEELKSATNSYADHMKLGAGGFGTVFKGVLEDGTVVAIKKANLRNGNEGDREQFLNEMAILVRINHRHIVRLLGCCLETAVPLLVYEFISNGNLEENLEGSNGTVVMGWQQRLEVARQTVEALAYLHAAASPPILHRDVKSANVLLDDNFDAKVADFGLSRLVLDGAEEAATALQGTIGYLDPEYFQTLELTDKSDVYSLGVILVELITGLKPVDSRNREPSCASLALLFIHHMKEGKLYELIDSRLNLNPSNDASFRETHASIMAVAALARRCLDLHGSRRPSMSHVVDKLHYIVQSLKCGNHEEEDENAPLLSSKKSEMIEYGEAGAIMPDDPNSQCDSVQSGSINNLLINAPTLPR